MIILTTNFGDIEIELNLEKAPVRVNKDLMKQLNAEEQQQIITWLKKKVAAI